MNGGSSDPWQYVPVIHPTADSYVRAAAQEAGGAAAKRDRDKRANYSSADPNGYAFTPLSMETYGRLGKPAMGLLNTLAETAADAGVAKDAFVTNALRELSISLCRSNAVIYRAGLTVMAQAAGTIFWTAQPVPFANVL